MSTEDWAVFLITAAAIPSTLALLFYALLAQWYRSVFGRARVTAELGWVTLLDLALYVHWSHWLPPDWLRLTLYTLIAVGAWMWLGAIIHEQALKRRGTP